MAAIQLTGAASTEQKDHWTTLKWPKIQKHVLRFQARIAKAEKEGKRGKVKALQRLLTSSFSAKCMAVKRVTSKPGSKTPGIDGKVWRTNHQKMQGVLSLKRHGYKPQPLRRIYIPKRSGKDQRPISIPAIHDKGQQMLHLLALEPLVEERADPNAYGFRLKRSAHDAQEQCFNALGKPNSPTWILEGDIKSCFCKISHDYLLREIPMDKVILRKFLKSGIMEKGQFYPTTAGVGQGGSISAALAVMALSGLEPLLQATTIRQRNKERINMISYADDFVVTAASQDLLEQKVMPILTEALAKVGLELSTAKTKITHINDGFDFLGFNVRKYKNGKLLIKPARANIRRFLKDIRNIIRKGVAWPTEQLIHTLNSRLTGWSNYYRTSVSSKTFSKIDHVIFQALMRMLCKRHARKGKKWIVRHYFTTYKGDHWRFHCMTKDKEGKKKPFHLKNASNTKIRRHIKIVSAATPFNPLYKEYFKQREQKRIRREAINNFTHSAGLKIIQPY